MIQRLLAILVRPSQTLAVVRAERYQVPPRAWRRHSALLHYSGKR